MGKDDSYKERATNRKYNINAKDKCKIKGEKLDLRMHIKCYG